jgi:hypothetical protein
MEPDLDSIRIWSQKERKELPYLYTSTIEAYLEEKEGWLLRTQFVEVPGKSSLSSLATSC